MTPPRAPTEPPSGPVFFDATRRRAPRLRALGAASGVVIAILLTVFVVSIAAAPALPVPAFAAAVLHHAAGSALPLIPSRDRALRRYALRGARAALLDAIAHEETVAPPAVVAAPAPATVVAAFYAPWEDTGLASLRAHASHLTHVLPVWLHLGADGVTLDDGDWSPARTPHSTDVVQIARSHGVRIVPVLTNSAGDGFDAARVHALLASPEKRAAFVAAVSRWLATQRFDGVNVDFEELDDDDYRLIPGLLAELRAALAPAGRSVSADIEVGADALDWSAVAEACDFVIVMAYDEHWETSEPGPIASIDFVGHVLATAASRVPREKVVIGVGGYAYDWARDGSPAESLGFEEAVERASEREPTPNIADVLDFDPTALEPTFDYAPPGGPSHTVWILDAVTVANEWELARGRGARGAALWALGTEDPSTWSTLDAPRMRAATRSDPLRTIALPYDVEFEGDGEILEVVGRPHEGRRRLEHDDRTGMIVDEELEVLPDTYRIRRLGLRPKTVALTFDDGPSTPYTGQILDALRELHVPATFFVVGENAEDQPGLVQRIAAEGHELGNHTYTHPNIAAVSTQRARLEINATQRALESLVGRSTLLFRPPYNADAEPTSAEEVAPIVIAADLGYVTVGEYVDPTDWYLGTPAAPRTAADIERSVIHDIHGGHGNVVLLHDGGGDRSRTVAALRPIVTTLRLEGYRFVLASDLVGATRAEVMPVVSPKETAVVGADRVLFELAHLVDVALATLFLLGIALGVARVLLVATLALVARGRERALAFDAEYHPKVSVLIAAYNEERVIARTVRRILDSDYGDLEVIVVDDGSKDATADAVERDFGSDARVRVVRQANAGKGAALNRALELASGEVFIGLDADTIFATDAVRLLVRHFHDPRVGAVAGNVKVGNRINVLTQWQSIEYITSQNLDRRAYALLDAVAVVPGAVGAWRRSAVAEVGGYLTDTMAEDMDLTWRVRRAGWKIGADTAALAYTEAPDTWGGLFKQRFRWAFGTLQCLWKHRGALGRYGWFGRLVLPTLWVFQILFQLIAPIVDLQVLWAVGLVAWHWLGRNWAMHEWAPLPEDVAILVRIAFLYALFFIIDLVGAAIAFALDRESPRPLAWLFWQRFAYRQLMYAVVLKSARTALAGPRTGWGKLERKGTVRG